jgi:hypothetical protein
LEVDFNFLKVNFTFLKECFTFGESSLVFTKVKLDSPKTTFSFAVPGFDGGMQTCVFAARAKSLRAFRACAAEDSLDSGGGR